MLLMSVRGTLLFILPDGKTILVDAGPEDAGKKLLKNSKSSEKKNRLIGWTHPILTI